MHRPLPSVVVIVAMLLVACSGDGDDPADTESSPGDEEAATEGSGGGATGSDDDAALPTTTITDFSQPVLVEIVDLQRGQGVVALELRVTNQGDGDLNFHHNLSQGAYYNQPSGVTLLDTNSGRRHFPLVVDDDTCVCTGDLTGLAGGESLDMGVAFPAPPDDVDRVTVLVPGVPPFFDVPLAEATEEDDIPEHREPQVLDLRFLQDALDDGPSRDETGQQVSLVLAGDVLFATNESTLTPDANASLEEVAREIDDARVDTVQIDGHTDDTGTDTINVPLSEARAASVEQALRGLVEGDITFQAAGHGSSQPVATNDTDEGRQRNRRVTVTYERVEETEPTTTTAPAGDEGAAVDTGEPFTDPADLPVLAEHSLEGHSQLGDQPDMVAEVRDFTRSRDGYVSVLWSITNRSNQPLTLLGIAGNPIYEYCCNTHPDDQHGIGLRDEANGVLYHPVMDTDMDCLCSNYPDPSSDHVSTLGLDQTTYYWAVYRLPADLATVDVGIIHFGTMADVPVQ